MNFKIIFISEQTIFVHTMSMRDVNSDNVYELWKLKLMTPRNIGCGAVSDTDVVGIRGNRKCIIE